MAARNGSAEWKGDLQSGTGTLSLGSGSFSGPYSFTSRFEDGSGTNPEELIAAAHAACFAMAMSAILAQEGHPVDSVRTTANVTLRRVDDAPTITKIELTAEGKVPGIDEAHFAEVVEKARQSCLVSRALAGVPEITATATFIA
ncbi:MAG: OsmC family peroxiredoxin [Solirubrobacteraceae bacterium]|nr:OsmC family peroxiredoxin [Solirubrobacteraceae bacterium]